MATQTRATVDVVRHDNHTAPSALTERVATKPFDVIVVYNSDGTNEAEISFDGTNTFPIPAKSTLSMEVSKQKSYWTKLTTGTPALKVMLGSEI